MEDGKQGGLKRKGEIFVLAIVIQITKKIRQDFQAGLKAFLELCSPKFKMEAVSMLGYALAALV